MGLFSCHHVVAVLELHFKIFLKVDLFHFDCTCANQVSFISAEMFILSDNNNYEEKWS
jgi:hypothetical protein